MLRIPDHIAGLVEVLQSKPSLLARFTSQEDPRLDAIRQLGTCRQIGAVVHLAPLIFGSYEISIAASEAIGNLIGGATGPQLLHLDEELRASYPLWKWDEWQRLKPAQIGSLRIPEEATAAVYGVLSFHHNGHVREEAVRRLGQLQDGSEPPFLLIRLNDWVAPIHDLSRTLVQDRIAAGRFLEFFDQLDLIFWLETCTRHDHLEIVRAVVRNLASIESAECLRKAIRSGSRLVRRRAYRSSIDAGATELARIVRLGLSSDDGVLRLWAARDAKFLLPDGELEKVLPAILDDRFLPVRREALHCVMTRLPNQANDILKLALLDPSQSLREFARFYLRKTGEVDVSDYYRENLNRPDTLEQAIVGLGETGYASDKRLIISFLLDQRPRIRAAAIRCIGLLSKGQPSPILFDAIQDDSRRVMVEACNALEHSIDAVDLPRLAGVLRNDVRPSVLLSVLDLVDKKETWEAMPYLVEAAASRDSDVARLAAAKIRSKFNHVFTSPTPDQRDAIRDVLQQSADSISPEFAVEFTQWVASRDSN